LKNNARIRKINSSTRTRTTKYHHQQQHHQKEQKQQNQQSQQQLLNPSPRSAKLAAAEETAPLTPTVAPLPQSCNRRRYGRFSCCG
jgi:hypothetical protein